MPVISGALTVIFVIIICLIGLKMLLTALGLQFTFLRGAIIWKAARRFKKGIVLFAGGLTAIALIGYYVTPVVGNMIVATGEGISSSADAIGSGAATAGGAVWEAVPIIVGIVLGLLYWAFISAKWIDKARSKDGRYLRQIGAFALFMLLLIGYIAAFIT